MLTCLILLPCMYLSFGTKNLHNQILEILYDRKLLTVVLLRTILTVIAFPFYFLSIEYITIGDATAIQGLTGMFTAIFGWVILKESVSKLTKIFIFISLIGVFFISRSESRDNPQQTNSFYSDTIIGITLGLTRVVLASLSIVYTRAMGVRVNSMLPMFLDATISVSCFIPLFLMLEWTPVEYFSEMNLRDFYCLSGIALANVIGGTFGKMSLEYENSAIATVIFNTRIIFSYIWQWTILKEESSWEALVGAALIFGSAVLISFQK